MIGFLRGRINYLAEEYCLIETAGGVGYRVFMPSPDLAALSIGAEIGVRIHTSVREDAILLFGFLNQASYDLFIMLIGVSGIGPKVALGVLSGVKPDEFYLAVQNRDIKCLTKLPGIGKKTAERLLLELKDKVGGDGTVFEEFEYVAPSAQVSEVSEAIEALQSLGYANNEIIPVVKGIEGYETMSCENIIRLALKSFAGRK